jgi:D-alanyl-D-alanine carboxypeptidase
MMTAVIVDARTRPGDRVLISRQAVHYTGSGVGVLPFKHHASVLTLLYGLLLPSGNDAAIALAQHVAGTQRRFIGLMNSDARRLGLTCTHFNSVSGIVDQGNYSCARDLARLAHVLLQRPLLARIVSTRSAVMPLPVKGGKVYLYNNNPLLVTHFPGTDGVKTGYTVAAGRCLVVTVHRGRRHLGAVLLNSADPPDQAKQLFTLAFRARS